MAKGGVVAESTACGTLNGGKKRHPGLRQTASLHGTISISKTDNRRARTEFEATLIMNVGPACQRMVSRPRLARSDSQAVEAWLPGRSRGAVLLVCWSATWKQSHVIKNGDPRAHNLPHPSAQVAWPLKPRPFTTARVPIFCGTHLANPT